MALHPDSWKLRDLQTGLTNAGLAIVDSFVSITELSEYAQGHPRGDEEHAALPGAAARGQERMVLLPDDQAPRRPSRTGTDCPTTSARSSCTNTARRGRKFAGRIVQLITASTGPRRLGVGRHPVRGEARRPQGHRLHDALRHGIGPLRRLRALLHGDDGPGRGDRRPHPLERSPGVFPRWFVPYSGALDGPAVPFHPPRALSQWRGLNL